MLSSFRKYFLYGLVVFLPLLLTIYLFVWGLTFADNLLRKFVEPYFLQRFGFYFKGLSIIIGVYIIVLIGFFATNYFGKKIYMTLEGLILRLPFFRQVYPALKEIALFLFSRDKLSFKQVVIVEYPRKGIYSIGFLTNESSPKIRQALRHDDLCNIFIPSAPGPLTGYVIMVSRKDIVFTDVSVEDAIKFNVSGGVVNPFLGA